MVLKTENRQPIIEIFNFNVLHEATAKDYSPEEMLALAKSMGWDLGVLFLTLIAASIVKGIIKRIPVPTFFINEWDQNNDIGTILGRYICAHFRGASSIGHEDWCNLVDYAEGQRFYFYKATQNKNLLPLFIKYDELYKKDLIPTSKEEANAVKVAQNTISTNKPVQPKADPAMFSTPPTNQVNPSDKDKTTAIQKNNSTNLKEQSEPVFTDSFNSPTSNNDNEPQLK